MSVPKEIREVPRPVNTVVVDNGGNSPKRYAVRKRAGVKYVRNGNPQPVNGEVIGYITNGKFVEKKKRKTASDQLDMLSYGAPALVRSVSGDILDELLEIYDPSDAYRIIVIAALRVIRPSLSAGRLASEYRMSFLSRWYPGVHLSANTVTDFYKMLGEDGEKRRAFFTARTAKVAKDHHLAIDGTLVQDTSVINDLSAFSYKAKKKGCREISIIYAYDIESMEPVCAQVFPGNSIDASSYAEFITTNDIKKGIIVDDKGFPPSKIKSELEKRPDLHFLTPIKRNDKRIANNGMLDWQDSLKSADHEVLWCKKKIRGGRYLYAFKDIRGGAAEAEVFTLRSRKNGKGFSTEKFKKKEPLCGVIVYESDLDMDAEAAFATYEDRWLLELVFRTYKNDLDLDRTNVQNDFSVIGSEMISFISTLMTTRILNRCREAKVLEKKSYRDMMHDLSVAWRYTDAPENPKSDDGRWVHTLPMHFEMLEALGLSEPAPDKEYYPAFYTDRNTFHNCRLFN